MARLTATHRQRHEQAAYVLRLTERSRAHPVPGNPVAALDGTFPLPIPPQAIRATADAYLGVMDTRDGRIIDEQGVAPPEFEVQGQFLITPKRANGALLDGYEFQRALEHFINYYLTQNRERARARQPLLAMEWHDVYGEQHWVVAPRLVPIGQRDSGSPVTEKWTLKLTGVQPAENPTRSVDTVGLAMRPDPNTLVRGACPHPSHAEANA